MVKTRFAPSPTGYLHIGNVRTALFSYLFARHNQGKFLLRIEDTDLERSKKEFEEDILKGLRWLSLEWDEFFRQSERLEIYKSFAQKLLKEGKAYPCFCTQEEIEKEREEAKRKGIPYRYSGKCRKLKREEAERKIKEGVPYAIRFKVPENEVVTFEDLIKGKISINTKDFGDFVIVRTNGIPTYNFVVVIDDALSGITHVIRGEDHLSNTPKQILIYRALGFKVPKFAHLPVILGKDRSKLSKRHGAVSLHHYIKEGYIPEALFNYLCLLGWSPPEGREILRKEEIVKLFDLKDVNNSPAIFDEDKLRWMSGVYIREVLSLEELTELALNYLKERGKEVDREYLKRVLERTRDSFNTFSEMLKKLRPFFEEVKPSKDSLKKIEELDGFRALKEFSRVLRESPLEDERDVKKVVRKVQKNLGFKAPQVWKSLRLALTDSEEGINLELLILILGKEEVLRRIEGILRV